MREILKHPFTRLRNSILCRRDVSPASAWQVIGWWEARRIPFNLVVGIAGLLSCIAAGLVSMESWSYSLLIRDSGLPGSPFMSLMLVIIYAIVANIFFTGGWIGELVIRKLWPSQADRFATLTCSLGVTFSVLLTLAPGIILGAVGIFVPLARMFGALHNR